MGWQSSRRRWSRRRTHWRRRSRIRARFETMVAELTKIQSKGIAQAQVLFEDVTRVAREQIAFAEQLSGEWRKLWLASAKSGANSLRTRRNGCAWAWASDGAWARGALVEQGWTGFCSGERCTGVVGAPGTRRLPWKDGWKERRRS